MSTATVSFHAAAADSYGVSVAGADGTLVVGGDLVCNTVPHLAGSAAVFLAGAGGGLALIIIAVTRRSRKRAVNSSAPWRRGPAVGPAAVVRESIDLGGGGDGGQAYRCASAATQ